MEIFLWLISCLEGRGLISKYFGIFQLPYIMIDFCFNCIVIYLVLESPVKKISQILLLEFPLDSHDEEPRDIFWSF